MIHHISSLKRDVVVHKEEFWEDQKLVFSMDVLARENHDGDDQLKDNFIIRSLASLGDLKGVGQIRQSFQMTHSIQKGDCGSAYSTNEFNLSMFSCWLKTVFDNRDHHDFISEISEVIPSLMDVQFKRLGSVSSLQGVFTSDSRSEYSIPFDNLSDGQKSLILLYAIAHFLLEEGVTLLIDEPENFIALSEMQTWLYTLLDFQGERGGQIIFCSHHPEFYDQLAPEHGIILYQKDSKGLTSDQFRKFVPDETLMSPSELIARGEIWEHLP